MESNITHYEDGGIREEATGKGFYKYMSMVGLRRLAYRYEYGARKYGASDNYKKGLPVSNCWDSAMRHLVAYMEGDNSEDHLAACAWNCFAMMELETRNPKWQDVESRKKYRGKALDYRNTEVK